MIIWEGPCLVTYSFNKLTVQMKYLFCDHYINCLLYYRLLYKTFKNKLKRMKLKKEIM